MLPLRRPLLGDLGGATETTSLACFCVEKSPDEGFSDTAPLVCVAVSPGLHQPGSNAFELLPVSVLLRVLASRPVPARCVLSLGCVFTVTNRAPAAVVPSHLQPL